MSDNHAADIEVSVSSEALEKVDLRVQPLYEVEMAAADLMDALTGYWKAEKNWKAAEQNKDERTGSFAKEMVFWRNKVALLQHQNPEANQIAHQLMELNAHAIRRNRAKAVKEEEAAKVG